MTLYPLTTRLQLSRLRPARFQWGLAISLLVAATLIFFAGFLYIYNSSDVLVRAVEMARDVFGPQPVAIVEELAFKIEDWYHHVNYQVTGNASSWQFVAPATASAAWSTQPKNAQARLNQVNSLRVSGSILAPNSASTFSSLSPVTPIVANGALPDEGQWHPLTSAGQLTNQAPILWSTYVRPDPDRPYARVALVAMDLSRSRLHLMIGTKEPESTIASATPRPGMIPADIQTSGTLLAAWNGGFRAIHGHYGMMSDGVTWLPAEPGMATLAVKRDGQVLIGAWGREVTPTMDLLAWRQNNPPLIENGLVNPDVHAIMNLKEWGLTIANKAVTWRSGLGLTKDGRWLIYVAGNSLSTETLTAALQAAGAYNAMQTDINNPYDRFDTYTTVPQQEQVNNQRVTLPLTAQKLIDQMKGGPDQFLVPYERDFFYLTSQATPAKSNPSPSLMVLWQSIAGLNKLISLKK